MKLLCLNRPISNRFYPLFEGEEIIGTQFLPEDVGDDGSASSENRSTETEPFGIKLPNFRANDFQFKTDLASSGYK